MNKYYPPEFNGTQFNCIYCGVFASQRWVNTCFDLQGHSMRVMGIKVTPIKSCQCTHCDKYSYWFEEKMIIPAEAPVAPAHQDMPETILTDYNEARSIFASSPRAAAALLRLAIQKLMIELGEKGENINADIKSLVAKGLPVLVQQAFDYCRVVGNNAVHPGEINLSDTPEMAQSLFDMINFIIENRITQPKHIEMLYGKLPVGAREAVNKRDS